MPAPERREISVADLDHPKASYPWLTASLIPRAIAWVSTVAADGSDNLAPHSFTTVAATEPPTVCFVSIGHKDTLRNCRDTGEFVLNIGTEALLNGMNDSATPLPQGHSEFDAAALEREPSRTVRPARVASAPVAFECRVSGEHAIGDDVMVFGEVLHIAARADVLADDGYPDARKIAPLARLGRSEWSTLGEIVELDRISWRDWQAGRRSSD